MRNYRKLVLTVLLLSIFVISIVHADDSASTFLDNTDQTTQILSDLLPFVSLIGVIFAAIIIIKIITMLTNQE